MSTICLDFGTSSLRAAILREGEIVPVPLAIAPGSPLDNASIPSAIFVSASGSEVCFGIEALSRGLASNDARLFELSPKSWLGPEAIDSLDNMAMRGLPFTRRDLIGGLLTFAVEKSLELSGLDGQLREDFELRISHPAWPTGYERLSSEYESLRRLALARNRMQMKPAMTVEEFASWCLLTPGAKKAIDVKEPVAAAVAVYRDVVSNTRSVILMIDIGAGTIDLGLFVSVIPDDLALVRQKLLELAIPESLYGAGDLIDQELLEALKEESHLSAVEVASLANGIRRRKENLFNVGQTVFGRRTVTVSDITKRPRVQEMAIGLKEAVQKMFHSARHTIDAYASNSFHPIDTIHVVFAGGGANIEFLRKSVGEGISASGIQLNTQYHSATTPSGFPVEASMARMAVAIGGAQDSRAWPETTWQKSKMVKGLGPPLHR